MPEQFRVQDSFVVGIIVATISFGGEGTISLKTQKSRSSRERLSEVLKFEPLFSKINDHPANDLVVLHFVDDVVNFVQTTSLHDRVNLAFCTELECFG